MTLVFMHPLCIYKFTLANSYILKIFSYHYTKGFLSDNINDIIWDAWVAQLVKHPTLAQVMISQFVSSSPALGSVLTAQSLKPASDSVSPLCPPPLARVRALKNK